MYIYDKINKKTFTTEYIIYKNQKNKIKKMNEKHVLFNF